MSLPAEGKMFLGAIAGGFVFCMILLWYPERESLHNCEIGREQEIYFIKTQLLSPEQKEKLTDWEEEGEYFAGEDERQDRRTRQPEAK